MNSRIQGVEDADHILVVGCNLRAESPLLNARVLKAVRSKKCKVSVLGPFSDQTYEFNHLGSDPNILQDLLDGKHELAG